MTANNQKKKGMEPEETRRSSGLISFGTDVRKLLSPLLGKKGLIQADILAHWQDILGPELACGVTPFSISFSKRTDGVILTVKAFSGAYAVEFSARKKQIIDRLNSYFGYAAIDDIRIVQGGKITLPPLKQIHCVSSQRKEEIQTMTSGIQDKTLREAAINLGLSLPDPKKD